MRVIEIHIKNMECELSTELPTDITLQAFYEIKDILKRHRIKCDIDLKTILSGTPKMMKIDCIFDTEEGSCQ